MNTLEKWKALFQLFAPGAVLFWIVFAAKKTANAESEGTMLAWYASNYLVAGLAAAAMLWTLGAF